MMGIERILFLICYTLLSFAVFITGVYIGNIYLMLLPLFVLLGILSLNHPGKVFIATVSIMNSKLIIPGMPGDLELYHVGLFVVCFILMLGSFLDKSHSGRNTFLTIISLAYAVVAFYTMLLQGFGFRIIGSDQAGGMRYVLVYIGSFAITFLPRLKFSEHEFRKMFIYYVIFSFLPLLGELLLFASGGAIYHQYYFFHLGFGVQEAFFNMIDGSASRFTSAAPLGRALILAPFIIFVFNKRNYKFYFIYIAFGFVMVLFAGYRNVLVQQLIFVFVIVYLLISKTHRKPYLAACVAAVMIAVSMSYILYDYLPFGIQRTLVALPGLGRGSEAHLHALASNDFRMGVFELGVQEIPKHLLLGRGMTYSLTEVNIFSNSPIQLQGDQYMEGLLTNLHHGPLEVLVFLGIPGVLCFVLFNFACTRQVLQVVRGKLKTSSTLIYQIQCVLAAQILTRQLMFVLGFGNPYATFLILCVEASLLLISMELNTIKETKEPA